ncbi:Putative exosome complex exonuclease [Heterostelium album PN500]|uniref:Exosome complex component RRP45 n=1 Tax=Heterostelium pallidum (strain ATCC 26659 / Pp 5 / PN500) TaxID=670386 RepID=D3BAF1_HETP5|nr:Putative exosome complex exonuclease [Heterostelium album PN500]EFA81538.1 Putative exosome complex exonuclease [Heterostelium album PN500]|eukprot:XP_020433655.1 Putative exosome complex exonuclease [Heterostelium album PN500]
MKEILSKNEKDFILSSIDQGLRVDGRRLNDMRSIKINFGKQYGMVEVQLGRTRVYTTVTCEVTEPKPERPNEGFFIFNTDVSPMSSVSVDSSRGNPVEAELGRLIERGLKESRAIDTEALCIVAGSKVWKVKTNVHVLDDCGNLLDCASISVITALLHFRKPDVTVVGNDATIHPIDEREPVPLSIHHTPISITFGFFPKAIMIVDPDNKEEQVMDGKLSFYVNVHKEICGVSKGGGMSTTIEQVIKCSKISVIRATEITQLIREALHQNIQSRQKPSTRRKGLPFEIVEHSVPEPTTVAGTTVDIKMEIDTNNKQQQQTTSKPTTTTNNNSNNNNKEETKTKTTVDTSSIKQQQQQNNNNNSTTSNVKNTDIEMKDKKKTIEIDSDSDSEEEDTVVLSSTNTTKTTPSVNNPAKSTTTKSEEPTITSKPAVAKQQEQASPINLDEDSEDLSVALLKKKPAAKKKAAAKK